MGKTRLEAFSDGVIAIIITIMVLELKVPHGDTIAALLPLGPVFFSYVLSFIYVGIYWNNHHHMMHAVSTITGGMLWANLHLLFWLSLTPFVTGWMGENRFASAPVALYGVVLFMCGLAYMLLVRVLTRNNHNQQLAAAIGKTDVKAVLSMLLYLVGVGLSFVNAWVGFATYVLVAALWLIPEKRIEQRLAH